MEDRHKRPTISSCSAGVGRTGTLIAIDIALEQAARQNMVDIPAIVTKMRRQRMKMVQTSVREVFTMSALRASHKWAIVIIIIIVAISFTYLQKPILILQLCTWLTHCLWWRHITSCGFTLVPKSVSSLIMRWHAKYVSEFISTVDRSLHAIHTYHPDLWHLHIKIIVTSC